MKKLLSIALGAFMVPVVAFSSVAALAAGQIEGGDIYRVANLNATQVAFTDPVSATCNDTVQFKVRIHNPGPDALTAVNVKATLPTAAATSHSSKVTVTAQNANPSTTTDTAGVNLDKAGTLRYVAGSTELLDAHNSKLTTLADGIVSANGVTLTDPVGVSTEQKRYVQFQAKVECPTPPKNITVCELATKKIVTIREDQFDASKYSKNLDDCKTEEVKKITVCELATKKIVTINEKDFNSSKYSKDLSKCAPTPPTPGQITVCELATKTVVNISEDKFDASKYSKDLSKCETTPETPAVIASTGPTGAIATMLGLSSVAAGATYFVQRRRNILG